MSHNEVRRRVSVFGGLSVNPPLTLNQPRPLATLALIAASAERGVSRDRLLSLLWSERDESAGRAALSQTLYQLRQALGAVDAIQGTNNLRLDPRLVTSDLGDFQAALTRGDLEAAVAVYSGPFLHGFHLSRAAEFDEWVETERVRLNRTMGETLEKLWRRDLAAGAHPAAIRWMERIVEADPYGERSVRQLAETHAAAGDPVSAIRAIDALESRLRRDLDVGMDSSLAALRQSLTRPAASHPLPHATQVRAGPGEAAANPPATRKVLRSAAIALGMVVMAAIGTAVLQRDSSDRTASTVLAVLPFAYHGNAELAYIVPGLADLVARNMVGIGGLRVLDPQSLRGSQLRADSLADSAKAVRALDLGATHLLRGEIIESGGRVRIAATITSVGHGDGEPLGPPLEGRSDELFALADQLSTRAAFLLHPNGSGSLARSAATTTASLEAFRRFIEGEDHFRARRFLQAAEAFEAATRADSAFAMAYYRLSQATDYVGRTEQVRRAAQAAEQYSARLPLRDRLLLQGNAAWVSGDLELAEQVLRQLVRGFPESIEGTLNLAEVLFHGNPFRGRSLVEARLPFETVLRLDPGSWDSWSHLGRILAQEETRRNGMASTRLPPELEPMPTPLEFWREGTGDSTLDAVVLGPMARRDDNAIYASTQRVASHFGNLRRAEAIARLLIDQIRPRQSRALGYVTLAEIAFVKGRAQDGTGFLNNALRLDPVRTAERWSLLVATLPVTPLPQRLIELDRLLATVGKDRPLQSDLAAQDTVARYAPTYLRGLLAARLGDSVRAWSMAAELHARGAAVGGPPLDLALARSIRALTLSQLGHPTAALAELEEPTPAVDLSLLASPFGPQSWQRFLRGRLLASVGRTDEALQWLSTMDENSTFDLVFSGHAMLERARILRTTGRIEEAVRLEARVRKLWAACDPEFKALMDTASPASA